MTTTTVIVAIVAAFIGYVIGWWKDDSRWLERAKRCRSKLQRVKDEGSDWTAKLVDSAVRELAIGDEE
jgi:hypothetical protein